MNPGRAACVIAMPYPKNFRTRVSPTVSGTNSSDSGRCAVACSARGLEVVDLGVDALL